MALRKDFDEMLQEIDEGFRNLSQADILEADNISLHMPDIGTRLAKQAGIGIVPMSYRPISASEKGVRPDAKRLIRHPENPVTLEYEAEKKQTIILLSDSSMDDESMRTATIVKSILARKIASDADHVSFMNDASMIRLSGNPRSTLERLQTDIMFMQNSAQLLEAKIPRHCTIFILGKFYEEEERLKEILEHVQERGAHGHLIRVMNEREARFNFDDNTELVSGSDQTSADGQTSIVFNDIASGRREWWKRFQAHNERLNQIAYDRNFTLYTQRTDAPKDTALLRIFENRPEKLHRILPELANA